LSVVQRSPCSTPLPYTTLFRSCLVVPQRLYSDLFVMRLTHRYQRPGRVGVIPAARKSAVAGHACPSNRLVESFVLVPFHFFAKHMRYTLPRLVSSINFHFPV